MYMGLSSIRRKQIYYKNFIRNLNSEKQHPFGDWEDFNMIRYVHKKSSETEYTIWMDVWNSFVNDTAIIEMMIRGGSRFTLTNMQENPVTSNLDMIFVTRGWEQQYPRAIPAHLARPGPCRAWAILTGQQPSSTSTTGRAVPLDGLAARHGTQPVKRAGLSGPRGLPGRVGLKFE
jgi:hypothetical protein